MTALIAALWLLAQGPTLELPPTDPAEAAQPGPAAAGQQAPSGFPELRMPDGLGIGHDVTEHDLLKGLQDARLRAGRTLVGGYGQLNVNGIAIGPDAPLVATANVRRLVLFVAHTFNDDFRAYTELEWENGVTCRTCRGSAEIEQAFIEWDLVKGWLSLRGGLLLVPFGIVNQWHEPPVFHGVERPRVDEVVVPSTWREMGVGLVGTPREGIHYELNLTTSLDATAFGPQGFANGRGNASLQPAGSWQLAGRFEVEPFLGVLMGASGIVGDVGGALWGDTPFFDVNGDRLKLALPLYGLNFDARIRRFGLEARAVYVGLFLPNAGDLLQTRRADGSAFFPSSKVDGITGGAVPTRLQGVYLEVAYDVFRPFHFTTHQLLPFVRVEFYDTQEGVPDGFDRNAFFTVREATFGLSYRPIQQVVVKAEAQLRNRVLGPDELQANAGLGFMF